MSAGTTYSAIIGNVIKKLRDEMGFSQGDMATKMGISQAAWSNLESGKSALSTPQLAEVAHLLGISVSDIATYADQAQDAIKAKGMTVTYDNKQAESMGVMLLGAAAVGAIIAAILLSKK